MGKASEKKRSHDVEVATSANAAAAAAQQPQEQRRKKQAMEVDEDEDDEDDEDDNEDGDEDDQDIIDVDFDFFDPKPIDFHAVKHLLANLFEDDVVDLSELADFLVQEHSVGTCVKVDGSSDPYSFLSVLNLTAQSKAGFVQQIRKYLLSKFKGDAKNKLANILDDASQHVGMLFNERLLNMPVQVSPPSFQMLIEEMQWACDDGLPFKFKYYVFLMKTYREMYVAAPAEGEDDYEEDAKEADDAGKGKGKGKGAKQDAKKTSSSSSSAAAAAAAPGEKAEMLFFNEEEEYILKEAILQVDFKLPKGRSVTRLVANGIQPYRKIVVIDAAKLPGIVRQMKTDITTDAVKPIGARKQS